MSDSRRIVCATCRAWPDLSASDIELANELQRRGHTVVGESWNDAPISAFTSADLVVLRSTWDYHHDLQAFEEWIDAVAASPAELHNDRTLVFDHIHKSYLQSLADQGVPTPSTLILEEFDVGEIRSWASDRHLNRVVVKPAWGASGFDVRLIHLRALDDERTHWEAGDRRDVLVQSYVPEIQDGEASLVFFRNHFSHALLRRPAAGDFRANSNFGSQMVLAPRPDQAKLDVARHALSTLSAVPTYARIDVVGSDDNVTLMELEINEPALGLNLAPGAAVRFADALVGQRTGSVLPREQVTPSGPETS
jgi:glutathione synthase/RimK-type ligase-like ATP-grasp enzyme